MTKRNTRTYSPPSARPAYVREQRLAAALERLLVGLAQHLLPAGLTPAYLSELVNRAFVRAAANTSRLRNGRINSSRIAVLTALRRAEVKRLLASNETRKRAQQIHLQRTQRVIDGWVSDRRYTDREGIPLLLPLHGSSISFPSLVRKFAGDVPPRAVLDELSRMGVVRQQGEHLELLPVRQGRHAAKTLKLLLDTLTDGLEATHESVSVERKLPIRRIEIKAGDLLDLSLMKERAFADIEAFLDGLRRALEAPTQPRRQGTKTAHQLSITVLVRDTAVQGRAK